MTAPVHAWEESEQLQCAVMNEVLVTKISLLFYQYPCKSALLFSLSKRALFKEGEQCQLHRSGVFIVSFDKISHIVAGVFIVVFEQANAASGNGFGQGLYLCF